MIKYKNNILIENIKKICDVLLDIKIVNKTNKNLKPLPNFFYLKENIFNQRKDLSKDEKLYSDFG